jgi:effector-binding domain-containing protein
MVANKPLMLLAPVIEEKELEVIGPPVEIWLDDPNQVKPEEYQTEIVIHVREKNK